MIEEQAHVHPRELLEIVRRRRDSMVRMLEETRQQHRTTVEAFDAGQAHQESVWRARMAIEGAERSVREAEDEIGKLEREIERLAATDQRAARIDRLVELAAESQVNLEAYRKQLAGFCSELEAKVMDLYAVRGRVRQNRAEFVQTLREIAPAQSGQLEDRQRAELEEIITELERNGVSVAVVLSAEINGMVRTPVDHSRTSYPSPSGPLAQAVILALQTAASREG